MVLKANDRRTSCPCHDELRGPRSDYVRQVALATTTTYYPHTFDREVCALKNIIDADSNDKNETNKDAPAPSSSEMRNIMKSMRSYLDSHSNGEINNKRYGTFD
ncbi:hypothetical protein TNCV_3808961 [Trichonephila clavipes]|nr:hypothetical protein TNCV_3808961 [Trichonephila clavipes]